MHSNNWHPMGLISVWSALRDDSNWLDLLALFVSSVLALLNIRQRIPDSVESKFLEVFGVGSGKLGHAMMA